MGLGLSEKGERLLLEDCEEAFEPVRRETLVELAKNSDNPSSLATRFLNCLEINGYVRGIPFSEQPREPTVLQALLFYQDLEVRKRGIFYNDGRGRSRAFGINCYNLLEEYLLEKGLLDEDSWEEPAECEDSFI